LNTKSTACHIPIFPYYEPVKTTIELPDHLLRQAKILAVEQGRTLKEVMTEALEAHLGATPPAPPFHQAGEGLDDDDPFFAALEQVRAWGNSQMPGKR
jgi:hypothetical protein